MPEQAVSPVIHAQAVVMESPAKLIEHPRNPRQGDVGAVVESIEANGYMAPIVVQKSTRQVIDGNHRLKAAVALGMDKVPVVWVDVDDDTALRYLLAANRTADLAAYDDNALVDLLKELAAGPGLGGTGYQDDDLDALVADLATPMPVALARVNDPPLAGSTAHRCPSCNATWTGSCTPE